MLSCINLPILIVLFSNLNKVSNHDNYYKFSKTENEITIILFAFLKLKKYDDTKSLTILKEIFDSYSEKLFVLISDYELNLIIKRYSDNAINTEKPCNYIAKKAAKFRLFLLYSLMDIAAFDKIYSVEEETFINNIRQKIRIPVQTFQVIKSTYSKKGMKEERKIIEEQKRKETRKKLSKSFLPYNAYKILGVSPTITKAQLKKVYRTLAKKYHPDKYHGQSDETIQRAEDKFQEILEAYEIIKKYKDFN